jgi:hypothetical protein
METDSGQGNYCCCVLESVKKTVSAIFHPTFGVWYPDYNHHHHFHNHNCHHHCCQNYPKKITATTIIIITISPIISYRSTGLIWRVVLFQEMVEPKHSSQFYVSQLRRHMDEALQQHTKPPKKLIKNLEPKEVILRSLEVDVRTHPNTT